VRQYISARDVLESTTSSRRLLVTRTETRVPLFWSQVRNHILRLGFAVDDFDDSKDLGTLEQQARVVQPAFIIAPHGARLLNMVGARPTACVIEFLPADDFSPCVIKLNLMPCSLGQRGKVANFTLS